MSEIKEAVQEIKSSLATNKTETLNEVEKKFAAAQALAEEANKKIEAEVKQLNEDLTKKGATLEEIQTQVKELKARSGRFSATGTAEEKAAGEMLAEGMAAIFDEIKAYKRGAKVGFETKAVGTMTASANLTGNVVASYASTPAIRGRRKVNFRDLAPMVQSSTGVWKFYRQNTPVGEGSFSFQTTHGAVKSQLDYDLTEVTVTAEYLAGFVRIAKQMLQDLPFLQTYVANELVEDFKRAESYAFFGQLISAATGSTGVNGATVYAEKLINWLANMMEADWDPTAIVTTAANWATLLNTKPSDYSVPGGITISPEGVVRVAGVPVYVANSQYIGVGKTLIGDWSKVAIIQTEGLNTNFYEQDSDNVQRNLITVKTEAREALAILRPDAFIYA